MTSAFTCPPPHDLRADRALDADWLRSALDDRRITPVIPSKSNRRFPATFDKETYKWRHLIENFFRKTQGKHRYRNAVIQNNSELRLLHLSRSNPHSNQVNVNRP